MDDRKNVIVCGVDCSPASDRALEWAVDEATRRGSRIRAVTVWSGYGMEALGSVSSADHAREEAERALDRTVNRVLSKRETHPEIERVVVEDTPSHALVMASLDAEMLVLGSRGHGAAHDVLLGSTSHRILHHAVCPVVVIPDPRRAERTLKHIASTGRAMEEPQGARS